MTRLTARELIAEALDPDSFLPWDEPIQLPSDLDPAYFATLQRARAATGEDESVLTGRATIEGIPVAVIVSEFGFLGGSVGVACADRIESAVRRATAEGLPLLAAPASGGTRMQEGTLAFVQMVRITAAIMDHRRAGLLYLVYLRDPTTGGVFASWGSLGHITAAEPGALIGFLGPKVYEALNGSPFPDGVQRAENLAAHGVLDAVVPISDLSAVAARTLRIVLTPPAPVDETPPSPSEERLTTWEAIERTRDPRRPGVADLLRHGASDVIPLSGTNEGESHPGILIALARIAGASAVVVGQNRQTQRRGEPVGPGALRQVRRAIRVSGELRLPLVSIIDTPGAALSPAAEEGGLGGEIARCLAELLQLRSPVVSVLLGEGAGGGALALLPADRIIAAENAWLAPLPPEGASAILHYGDTSFASSMAQDQGVGAPALHRHGIIDELIPEPRTDAEAFSVDFCQAIARNVVSASAEDWERRSAARARRFSVTHRT